MFGIMPEKKVAPKAPILTYGIIALLLIIIVALLYSNSQARSQPFRGASGNWTTAANSNQSYASLKANYSLVVSKLSSLEQNYTALLAVVAMIEGLILVELESNRGARLAPPSLGSQLSLSLLYALDIRTYLEDLRLPNIKLSSLKLGNIRMPKPGRRI